MIKNIEIFIFVACLLYCCKFFVKFIIAVQQEKVMDITTIDQILMYFSLSYIITSLVSLL